MTLAAAGVHLWREPLVWVARRGAYSSTSLTESLVAVTDCLGIAVLPRETMPGHLSYRQRR